ncbi:amidohydrolase family protein [Neobacillus sp. PS3-12]|uniref:amidohydrolase family protein n=1 Tax=Neobacillus sp. PS3-12 TaxID=3070677 RepID=UPI0027DFA452|nr:amidohydrolase family protein [Neobacillus sp. PS3-12]WML50913.1 amidohydrolase family protein [Neobacillus sp. PS3-12]
METAVQRASSKPSTGYGIIDCDVHQHLNSYEELKPYMPRVWWDRLKEYNGTFPSLVWRSIPLTRRDASPEEGKIPGSDPEFAKKHFLDKHNISKAILTGSLLTLSTHPNPDYAAAIATAFNDYTFDKWISSDDRWRASIVVATQDPLLAAKEIDRLGSHPKACQVVVTPSSSQPYGQRWFYPIFEACVRNNLPIALHSGGEGEGINTPPISAVGQPTTNLERHNILPIHQMSQLNSIVCEGVFERFPTLKVVCVEGGLAWLPHLMWRMDKNYIAMRKEVPWLKRKPSEYIIDHYRFTTQPIEEPENFDEMIQMLKFMKAEKTVLFASDYPHWDFDDPKFVLHKLPEEMRRRVAYENAAELYQLNDIHS